MGTIKDDVQITYMKMKIELYSECIKNLTTQS